MRQRRRAAHAINVTISSAPEWPPEWMRPEEDALRMGMRIARRAVARPRLEAFDAFPDAPLSAVTDAVQLRIMAGPAPRLDADGIWRSRPLR